MRRVKTLLCLLASLLLATEANAQGNPTGTVSGRVTGQDGAALPGVTVTAASPNLQGVRSVTTTAVGDYIIPFLPPGQYTLTFELQGFKSAEQPTLVTAAGTVTLDAKLQSRRRRGGRHRDRQRRRCLLRRRQCGDDVQAGIDQADVLNVFIQQRRHQLAIPEPGSADQRQCAWPGRGPSIPLPRHRCEASTGTWGTMFGEPSSRLAYQTPRTFRMSFGVRF